MSHTHLDFRPNPGRSSHFQMNVSSQQQPHRASDRQQQQSSGSGDYQPGNVLRNMRGIDAVEKSTERLESANDSQMGDLPAARQGE